MIEEVGGWPRRQSGEPAILLAHRGGSGPWRENTLEAFAAGLRLGADGVEFDVRRTSDGRLVVHHDAEVAGIGPIHRLRATELPDWIPGLDDALAACAGATVNVEIKNAPVEPGFDPDETAAVEVAAALAAVVGGREDTPAHLIVSSFWPASLHVVHREAPTLPLGLLVHPAFDATEAAGQAATMGCTALHPFHAQATPALVEAVHDLGLSVAVWTVNDDADLAAVAAAGVDVVISDRVKESRQALDAAVSARSDAGLVRGAHPRGQSTP
ncbi:MAG TPA: glycerophosphodiester phosphodiesterase [Acidimicrobiales bacterium]|nr:glycerophosphodiester phosphodiesterase [Acidimicrobiales bacterium]